MFEVAGREGGKLGGRGITTSLHPLSPRLQRTEFGRDPRGESLQRQNTTGSLCSPGIFVFHLNSLRRAWLV